MVVDLYKAVDSYKKRIKKFAEKPVLKLKGGKELKIRPENVKLTLGYMKHKEDYLKNVNGQSKEAKCRYYKTLLKELSYINNILYWFNDWDLRKITEKEISQVYNDLESDKLRTFRGKTVAELSKKDYYSKFMKNGFFEFFGKDKIAREVILRKYHEEPEVRFFELNDLKKMVTHAQRIEHRLMLWLMFDTGIEIQAILQLEKKDFTREYDNETKTHYWMVHVRKEISKKFRSRRDLYIHFQETNRLLEEYLPKIEDTDSLFNFGPRNAYKIVKELSAKLNIKVKPSNDPVNLRDFRSSMATYFLGMAKWSTDEVKARLGHKPSSRVIDRYVSYLGLNQEKKRKQAVELDFSNYKRQYEEAQETIRKLKVGQDEIKSRLSTDNSELREQIEKLRDGYDEMQGLLNSMTKNPVILEKMAEEIIKKELHQQLGQLLTQDPKRLKEFIARQEGF